MVTLDQAIGLESQRGSGSDLEEGRYHLVRHLPQVRTLHDIQARRGCSEEKRPLLLAQRVQENLGVPGQMIPYQV